MYSQPTVNNTASATTATGSTKFRKTNIATAGIGRGSIQTETGEGEEGEEEEEEDCVYDLFGVVNHLGGMFGGHYTAYSHCEDLFHPIPPSPATTATTTNNNNTNSSSTNTNTIGGHGDCHLPISLEELMNEIIVDREEDYTSSSSGSGNNGNGNMMDSTIPTSVSFHDYLMKSTNTTTTINSNNNTQEKEKKRWYKFDDEFVTEFIPNNNSSNTANTNNSNSNTMKSSTAPVTITSSPIDPIIVSGKLLYYIILYYTMI
jgi:hypothetical protein